MYPLHVKLQDSTTTEEFRRLLQNDEFDFRYKLGIALRTDSITIQEKPTIISAMAKHFTVLEVKAELQLLCGLSSTLGMLELVRSDPSLMRPLFVHTTTGAMTADDVYDVFTICYSLNGSNNREREEATIMKWVHFLQHIERKMASA